MYVFHFQVNGQKYKRFLKTQDGSIVTELVAASKLRVGDLVSGKYRLEILCNVISLKLQRYLKREKKEDYNGMGML